MCRCYEDCVGQHHRWLTLETLPLRCKYGRKEANKMDGPRKQTVSLWLHSTSSQRGRRPVGCFREAYLYTTAKYVVDDRRGRACPLRVSGTLGTPIQNAPDVSRRWLH